MPTHYTPGPLPFIPFTQVELTCDHCRRVFYRRRSRVRYARSFCSYECSALVRSLPLCDRFWERVSKTEGCWLWTGRVGANGYGLLSLPTQPRTDALAHRLSWELLRGSIGHGLAVLHHCDVTACVRPDHLFLGVDADNRRDCVEKGRHQHGERHWHAALAAAQVLAIRARYAEGGIAQKALGAEYGVGQMTVSNIITRKTWRHLE